MPDPKRRSQQQGIKRIIPDAAFKKLEEWLRTNDAEERSQKTEFLTAAIAIWLPKGFTGEAILVADWSGRKRIRCTFKKPGQKAAMAQDFESETLAFLLCLLVPGGRLSAGAPGLKSFFEVRLFLPGERNVTSNVRLKRRLTTLRIPTRASRRTYKPKGAYVVLDGLERAKQDATDRFKEVARLRPSALPLGFGGAHYAALLERAFQLLRTVPVCVEAY